VVTLRKAAQQALVAMKSVNHINYSWACVEAVAVLEAALAEDALQRLSDIHQEMEAQQEPVAIALHTGTRQGIKWLQYVDHNKPLYIAPPQRKPLTINEVEQILAQHNYEIHGDRARYIVRMTEAHHDIKGEA
jgi:hypothetical protein